MRSGTGDTHFSSQPATTGAANGPGYSSEPKIRYLVVAMPSAPAGGEQHPRRSVRGPGLPGFVVKGGVPPFSYSIGFVATGSGSLWVLLIEAKHSAQPHSTLCRVCSSGGG